MYQSAVAKEVEQDQSDSGSGLSELSRLLLRASYQQSTLSPEAKAQARAEAFATLVQSLDPRNPQRNCEP